MSMKEFYGCSSYPACSSCSLVIKQYDVKNLWLLQPFLRALRAETRWNGLLSLLQVKISGDNSRVTRHKCHTIGAVRHGLGPPSDKPSIFRFFFVAGACHIRRRRRFGAIQNVRPKSTLLYLLRWLCSYYDKPLSAVAKSKTGDDDTPKSFLRLIKKKSRKELIAEGRLDAKKIDNNLKIQPGESMREFRQYTV